MVGGSGAALAGRIGGWSTKDDLLGNLAQGASLLACRNPKPGKGLLEVVAMALGEHPFRLLQQYSTLEGCAELNDR